MRNIKIAILALILSLPNFAQAQTRVDEPLTRILFIFDASQSMYARWESGTRIDVARDLMTRMLDSLATVDDKKFQLALRMYGHQKPVPPQDCNDTRLEVPFSHGNIYKIKRRLSTVKPLGTTPIARSLMKAANDFPPCNNCRNIIILITDGIEACDEDPCAASRQLQKQGIALKPFVIGIGIDNEYKKTFDCVGRYFDAANEKTFKNVLGIVISQALDNTTAQLNLLDQSQRPTETNVPFTLFDQISGKPKYHFVHTLNFKGQPDTLVLDPLVTYKLVVHTIPPVTVDSIALTPGKHTHFGALTPRGTLEVKMPLRGKSDRVDFIVREAKKTNTLNIQSVNSEQKYLVGKYDLEILTLPRIELKNVDISQSKTTTISIPPSGSASFQANAQGLGSVFQVEGDKLTWVTDMDFTSNRLNLNLQPGQYLVIFRPKNAQKTLYSVTQKFVIGSGSTTIVKLH